MLGPRRLAISLFCATLLGCSSPAPESEPEAPAAAEIPVAEAELIASSPDWGNTEGPAVDSSGALYFTARRTYKGIIRWTEAGGPEQYAAVATMAGPGGLWIDAADNIYLTATDEREVQKLAPNGDLTTIAKGFEADPATAKGPNDITVSAAGVVYFTDPNGYQGEAAPGTVYWINAAGETQVFVDTVVGPNGIVLSADDSTLYVAHNSGESSSQLVSWPLAADGSAAGPKKVLASFSPCIADGMAVNADGRVWVTCYSYGMAHLIDPGTGEIIERISTGEKGLTNAAFGRGADANTLYLTGSDLERETGYVYRAKVASPGVH